MRIKKTFYSVGVDYGGTWVRVALMDSRKQLLLHSRRASMDLAKLPAYLKKLFLHWKISPPETLVVAAKGVGKKSKQKKLLKNLTGLAKKVAVYPDIELCYQSIFQKRSGIVLIAGTGSIAYGKNAQGKLFRAGGLGPQKGDQGSAYRIGKMQTKKHSVRKTALLAKAIILKAEHKNARAQKIVTQAQQHLSELVGSVLRQLKIKDVVTVGLCGGMIQNVFFKTGLTQQIRSNLKPVRARFKMPFIPMEEYAAQLGLKKFYFDPGRQMPRSEF